MLCVIQQSNGKGKKCGECTKLIRFISLFYIIHTDLSTIHHHQASKIQIVFLDFSVLEQLSGLPKKVLNLIKIFRGLSQISFSHDDDDDVGNIIRHTQTINGYDSTFHFICICRP